MYGRGGDWRGPPLPAQFALRVAVLGGVALVIFAIIFLRLWYLEVLSGDKYLAEAQNNRVRELTVRAPRGEILDREGRPLVQNRTALELQVNEAELPRSIERRRLLFDRLSDLAGMRPAQIRRTIRRELEQLPGSPATLRQDVPYDTVYYLRENQQRFPGVAVERVFVRRYPQQTLAAHVLGHVREASAAELKEPRYESLALGDHVGREGVEYTYDSLLRGVNGESRIPVDASGTPTGSPLSERQPASGNDLVLSLDSDVQAAGEAAIGRFGLPGGFVAMKVKSGELLGVGSTPTYDPAIFAQPRVPPAEYKALVDEDLGAPLTNRATQSVYPTGSTFKPITALAALDSSRLDLGETIADGGSVEYGGIEFANAGDVAHGVVDLQRALQVSSDVFFYIMGARTDVQEGDGGPIQAWARALGLGEPTGLDVGNEGAGQVPTPEQRNEAFAENTSPDSPGGEEVLLEKGEVTDRPWAIGDNINLAVGQGDLQADPLQMAVAYAAIANGGTVVRPHLGLRVQDPQGRTIQEVEPAPRRELQIDPGWQRTIMAGLRDAAMAPGGTSYDVFGGYPVEIAGKTGTAERPPNLDQSWYIAVAPYDDPKYVVAVTIEEGGFGVDTAAPAAREILNELLRINEQKIEEVDGEAAVVE